jgi:hypothetical protein
MPSEIAMKQAKPSADECRKFLEFMQGLESIIENGECPDPDSEPFDIRDANELVGWLYHQWHSIGPIWQRVFFAGQTAMENACDPNADTLEWKPELKMQELQRQQMFELLAQIRDMCCAYDVIEPVTQATEDGPWLPVDVMKRVRDTLNFLSETPNAG